MVLLMAVPVSLSARRQKSAAETAQPLTTAQQQRFAYYFYPAIIALDADDYDRAASLLTVCEQMDSTSAVVNYFLGAVAANMDRQSVAMNYFRKAALYDVEDYGYGYANELWKAGRHKEALEVMNRRLKNGSDKASTLISLNYMYGQLGQYSKQEKVLRELDKVTGRDDATVKLWAQYYVSRANKKKTLQVIDDYLLTDPANYELPVYKGDVLTWLGCQQEAEQVYLDEIRHHENNVMAYLSLANLYRRMKQNEKSELAIFAIMKQSIDYDAKASLLEEARRKQMMSDSIYQRSLEQLVSLHPTEPEALTNLATLYLEQSKPQDAIPLLQRQLSIQPDNISATVQLCVALNVVGEKEQSLQLSDNSLQKFDNVLFFYFNSCAYHFQHKQYAEVIRTAKKGVEAKNVLDEYYREHLYSLLGDAYMESDSMELAFETYDKVLAINPENIGVMNNYAYSLATHGGDLNKAERMSRHTIEQEPENPTYLDTYAYILYLKGESDMAVYYIKKARELMVGTDPDIERHYRQIAGAE